MHACIRILALAASPAGKEGLRLQLRRSSLATVAPERLEGVLLLTEKGGGKKAWAIEARKTPQAAEAAEAE